MVCAMGAVLGILSCSTGWTQQVGRAAPGPAGLSAKQQIESVKERIVALQAELDNINATILVQPDYGSCSVSRARCENACDQQFAARLVIGASDLIVNQRMETALQAPETSAACERKCESDEKLCKLNAEAQARQQEQAERQRRAAPIRAEIVALRQRLARLSAGEGPPLPGMPPVQTDGAQPKAPVQSTPRAAPATIPPSSLPGAPIPDGEEEAWLMAKKYGSREAFAAYLKHYPNGRHAAAARIALDAI